MHYPLCYGEVGAYSSATRRSAASFVYLRWVDNQLFFVAFWLSAFVPKAQGRMAGNAQLLFLTLALPDSFSLENCLLSCRT